MVSHDSVGPTRRRDICARVATGTKIVFPDCLFHPTGAHAAAGHDYCRFQRRASSGCQACFGRCSRDIPVRDINIQQRTREIPDAMCQENRVNNGMAGRCSPRSCRSPFLPFMNRRNGCNANPTDSTQTCLFTPCSRSLLLVCCERLHLSSGRPEGRNRGAGQQSPGVPGRWKQKWVEGGRGPLSAGGVASCVS
jgi:hypothetical protein